MYTDEESRIIALQENTQTSPRYDPHNNYSIQGMPQRFVELVVKNDQVDWELFKQLIAEARGPWTFRDTKDAFFGKLLDLGLLTFNPDWNYLVMTGDEFGCNPFYGFCHLYFTSQCDAFGYAIALYSKRDTAINVFRLQPSKRLNQ